MSYQANEKKEKENTWGNVSMSISPFLLFLYVKYIHMKANVIDFHSKHTICFEL
jgi:hypothetical protein